MSHPYLHLLQLKNWSAPQCFGTSIKALMSVITFNCVFTVYLPKWTLIQASGNAKEKGVEVRKNHPRSEFESSRATLGFPGGSGKEPTCQWGRCQRQGFDPWVRKIPWGGHGNPLQDSCLENPLDSGAWVPWKDLKECLRELCIWK